MDVRQELEREFERLLARLQAETDDAETHAAIRALVRVARAFSAEPQSVPVSYTHLTLPTN